MIFSYTRQPGISGNDQEDGKQDNINTGFQIWHSDIFSEETEFNNKQQSTNNECGDLERGALVESLLWLEDLMELFCSRSAKHTL